MYIKGLLENWDIEVTTRGSGAIYSAQLNLRFITKHMRYPILCLGKIENVLNIKQ